MRSTALLCCSLLSFAACASEDEQVLPVSTSTGSTTSRAPASSEAARRSNAFVRFVQAIPEVTSVDVYANDMRAFTGINYGTVTPYRELPKEDYAFRIRPAGQDLAVPMAEEKEGVSAGHHYTVVAFREKNEGKGVLKVFEDELTPPEEGSAKLRMINGSPDSDELDLFTPGAEKPLFDGVNYMSSTSYAQIKPMSGKIELHREGERTAIATLPSANFEIGRVYTVIVFGWTRTAPPSLQSMVIEDRFASP